MKYVLIQFTNDEMADNFTKSVNDAGDASQMRVRAVYKKPTQFCECNPQSEKSVRGQKYGWWVCAKCMKPKKGLHQGPRNELDPPGMKVADRQITFTVIEPERV